MRPLQSYNIWISSDYIFKPTFRINGSKYLGIGKPPSSTTRGLNQRYRELIKRLLRRRFLMEEVPKFSMSPLPKNRAPLLCSISSRCTWCIRDSLQWCRCLTPMGSLSTTPTLPHKVIHINIALIGYPQPGFYPPQMMAPMYPAPHLSPFQQP